MINLNEAISLIAQISRTNTEQIIPIENALGFVVAEDVFATYFMPRFNNSAMDGYAVLAEDSGKQIKIIDKILAGNFSELELENLQGIKVMTGAMVPLSSTCVVPQEKVKVIDENTIELPKKLEEYANIRFVGEDIKLGELLLKKGETINFANTTLLASQGITHIKVYKKVVVCVFASGEELRPHWENVDDYQIYNSNTPTLQARCKELGCEVVFVQNAKDSVESLKESIKQSLFADVIITSGGVSVGEADFTNEAFNALGFETIFSKVAIKPGKPVTFGKINDTYILNLPGNPLASSLVFEVLGKMLVNKLSGKQNFYPNAILGKLNSKIQNGGVHQIVPGFFDGEYFEPAKKRSPGMVNVLAKCNSIIIVDESCEKLESAAIVKIIPFGWDFGSNIKKDIYSL